MKKRENHEPSSSELKIPSPDLALETLKLFRIIFKSSTRHFHDIEKIVGMGGASLWAIAEISEHESLTVSGLAKAMSVHQSTASNLADKLEKDGYITRARSTEDRRIIYLSLTNKGCDVIAKAPLPYRGLIPDALMRLNPATLVELNRELSELILHMQLKHFDSAFEPLGKA